jgi:hypothetical protein
MRIIKNLLPMVLAAMLAGCGGGNSDSTPAALHGVQAAAVASRAAAIAVQASDYRDLVQKIYVAYFGRAADSGGLAYYETMLLNAGAPLALPDLLAAYGANPTVKAVIDSFSSSAESAALYSGGDSVFIDEVYMNLFNRTADSGGRAYWAGLVSNGTITRANAALSIMAGAVGTDTALVVNKTAVAAAFTAALNTDAKIQAYSGLTANTGIRILLANVQGDTDLASYLSTVDAAIAKLLNPVPPSPSGYYASTELRSNENYVTGHVVTTTPVTTYYKFQFDGAFDSAQAILLSKVIAGTPGTYRAALAVTDEPRIDTAEHAYLPQQGGVVYNVNGGKGWHAVTFGGSAIKTIGLASPADSYTVTNSATSLASDMLQLASVARNDGKSGAFLLMKITCIDGEWTQEGGDNALWDASSAQSVYRVRSLTSINGDGMADLTNRPGGSYYNGYGMMGSAQVHTTARSELLMFTGDSRDATAYQDYEFASQNVLAWMSLSTARRPLSIYNVAGSGHSELSFLAIALDRIVNGGLRPSVIFVPGFSQNGFDVAANYISRLDAFIASVRAVSGMSNVKFVISTDYFVNGYAGSNAEAERQLCIAHVRALADNVNIFLFDSDAIITDYTTPGKPKNRAAYMNADGVHANDVGIAAMASGVSGKPGLRAVYQTLLAKQP